MAPQRESRPAKKLYFIPVAALLLACGAFGVMKWQLGSDGEPAPAARPKDAKSVNPLHQKLLSWCLDKDQCFKEVCYRPVVDLPQKLAINKMGVYNPLDYLAYSQQLRKHNVVKGKKVLDIGTGTGVLALLALAFGAEKAVCTDINPAALKNASLNAKRFGYQEKMDLRLVSTSNPGAYAVIKADERFDLIIANPPNDDQVAQEIGDYVEADPGYSFLRSIISGIPDHLTPTGRLWLLYGEPKGLRVIKEFIPKGFKVLIYTSEGVEDLAKHKIKQSHRAYGLVSALVEITPPRK